MSTTLVHSGTGTTLSWTPTIGNLLVVAATALAYTSLSITDNYGNTWHSSVSKEDPSGNSFNQFWYCTVTTTGASMTLSSGGHLSYAHVSEWSGSPMPGGSVITTESTSGTGTAQSITTLAPGSAPGALLLCMYESYTSGTWSGLSSGWTHLTSNNAYSYTAYQIAGSPTTYAGSITYSASAQWASLAIAFGWVTPTAPTLHLLCCLGVGS